jgi:hypothetical protein
MGNDVTACTSSGESHELVSARDTPTPASNNFYSYGRMDSAAFVCLVLDGDVGRTRPMPKHSKDYEEA